MSNILGRRSSAYSNVTYLLDNYILPNTFYHEGENGACGETPPMAASAMQVTHGLCARPSGHPVLQV